MSIAAASIAFIAFAESAHAQDAPPEDERVPPAPIAGSGVPTPAPATSTADGTTAVAEPMGFGGDVLFLVPTGYLSNVSGPQVGLLLRLGYRVAPSLELTVRSGFLYGIKKEFERDFAVGYSVVPLWFGPRYFPMDPRAGLYVAAELAFNLLIPMAANGTVSKDDKFQPRIGANLGVGYVISRALPIDVRAQMTFYNLLLNSEVTNPTSGKDETQQVSLGFGVSAGYTIQF